MTDENLSFSCRAALLARQARSVFLYELLLDPDLGRVRLGYSGIRIYSGIGKFFVCQTNDYSWYSGYSGYSDALAVCYTKGSADFFFVA